MAAATPCSGWAWCGYNPFEDTGGNQSFALALLDADANGVMLTSLHSRQATRVYLRTIVGGPV